MKENKNLEDTNKTIKSLLDNFQDNLDSTINSTINSKTFKTSIYLLKYIDSNEIKYWNMFYEMFEKLNFEEQNQVLTNVSDNLKTQKNKNDNNQHNKVKIKDNNG